MHIKLFYRLIFSLCLMSCGDVVNIKPAKSFEAVVSTSKIRNIEAFIRSVAKRRELRVYEKNIEEMSYLTQGREAFYIAIYMEGKVVLDITNVGTGTILTIGSFNHKDVSIEKMNDLISEISSGLLVKFDVQLTPVINKDSRS